MWKLEIIAAYQAAFIQRCRYRLQSIAELLDDCDTDSDCHSVTDRDCHSDPSEDAGNLLTSIDLTAVVVEDRSVFYWSHGRVKQRLGPLVTEFERSLRDARRDEVDDDVSYEQLLQHEFAYGLPGTDEDHETIMDFAEKIDPLVTVTGHKRKWPRKVGYTGANKNWREV